METAISMETGLHFPVIKILICLEKPNCVVLAEHGILLNQSVKVSVPLSWSLVKKNEQTNRISLICLINSMPSIKNTLFLFVARCTYKGPPKHGFYIKGARNKGDKIKHGERITYYCFKGYTLVGNIAQECNNGQWNNDRPSCKGWCTYRPT